MARKLKWKPVFSFFCILVLIFFISALFNPTIGSIVVGSITGFIALFAGILPDHYNHVKDFWFDKILPGTHMFFIWVLIILSSVLVVAFFQNYKLSLKIENK